MQTTTPWPTLAPTTANGKAARWPTTGKRRAGQPRVTQSDLVHRLTSAVSPAALDDMPAQTTAVVRFEPGGRSLIARKTNMGAWVVAHPAEAVLTSRDIAPYVVTVGVAGSGVAR